MIEILFRGKRKCDGLWVKGTGIIHQTDFYGEKVNRYFIVDGTITEDNDIGVIYEVISKTVGQYTGLQDKNGTKIFDGDIIRDTDDDELLTVEGTTAFGFDFRYIADDDAYVTAFDLGISDNDTYLTSCIVIGNIHSTPELLEVE